MSDEKRIDEIPVQTPQHLSFELHMAGPTSEKSSGSGRRPKILCSPSGQVRAKGRGKKQQKTTVVPADSGIFEIFLFKRVGWIWRESISTGDTPNGPLYHWPSGLNEAR